MDGKVEIKTLGNQYCDRTDCLVAGSKMLGIPLPRYLAHLSDEFPEWKAAGDINSIEEVRQLLEAIIKALDQLEGCQCGPWRREFVEPATKTFYERIGCTRCNKWDEPPRMRNK